MLHSGSCHRTSDYGSDTCCAGNKPTSCWCWMEKQGRRACPLDDLLDWKAPSEAPPQESPRSDTILCSPSPFRDQHRSISAKKTKQKPKSQKTIFVAIKYKHCKYNTYLFFTDLMVDLIFKSLLHPSKRRVPIIFGNILTEAEGREIEKKKTHLNPFSYEWRE